jgi:hypothetical protein
MGSLSVLYIGENQNLMGKLQNIEEEFISLMTGNEELIHIKDIHLKEAEPKDHVSCAFGSAFS